jgi:tetraacyldisaccharide 4'-kinase
VRISPLLRILLRPASWLYGIAVHLRIWLYREGLLKQKRLNGAVISVGNLTVGGTGKTPMVIWLAEKLMEQGQRVAILSRGYKGSGESSDEVEVMRSRLQNRAMFGVGKDRFASGHQLESRQAVDVFLLDDGFQHLPLARDMDILLIDASHSLGKQALLPAGPMRERLSAMARADVLVFTRSETSSETREAVQRLSSLPVFASTTKLMGFRRLNGDALLRSAEEIGPGPFVAFCGIGNPGAFLRDLRRWGISPAEHIFFADHHRYTEADIADVERVAAQCGAKVLLTTEKDFWNLSGLKLPATPVYVATIDLEIAGERELLEVVQRRIEAHGAAA